MTPDNQVIDHKKKVGNYFLKGILCVAGCANSLVISTVLNITSDKFPKVESAATALASVGLLLIGHIYLMWAADEKFKVDVHPISAR